MWRRYANWIHAPLGLSTAAAFLTLAGTVGCGASNVCKSDEDCNEDRVCVDGNCAAPGWKVGPDGGPDTPPGTPEIGVPEEVELRSRDVGVEARELVRIRNRGGGLLRVTGIEIRENSNFGYTLPGGKAAPRGNDDVEAVPFELPPGASQSLLVQFTPSDESPDRTSLVVESNAPGSPTKIDLLGRIGKQKEPNDPCVKRKSKSDVKMGPVRVGATSTKRIAFENCSESRIATLEEISVQPSPPFRVQPQKLEIDPGRTGHVELSFAPERKGSFEGTLKIATDDPERKTLQIGVRGKAKPQMKCKNGRPTARATARLKNGSNSGQRIEANPLQTVTLDGSASSAPKGSIAAFEWSLVDQPRGSTARLTPNSKAKKPKLHLDIAGTYKIRLTVRDSEGRTSCRPVRVEIEAIPDDDIYIQLTWKTPADKDETDEKGTDLDLHYLHPSAKRWSEAPWDIYWDNPTADWGNKNRMNDNPRMKTDDTNGAGPETIGHDNPSTGKKYGVGVYYYAENGFGPSLATVRIRIGGKRVFEISGKKMNKFWFWKIAEIEWPTRNIYKRDVINKSGFPTP